MKIIRILFSTLFIVYFVQPASANDICGLYIAPRALFAVQETTVQAKFIQKKWGPKKIYAAKMGGSLALGYDFQPQVDIPIRFELEYGTFDHVSKRGETRILRTPTEFRAKLAIQTLLANLYADFPVSSTLVPFVCGGIGTAFIKSNVESSFGVMKQHTTVLAGQLGAGCSFTLTPNISVEAGYRFLMMDNMDGKSTSVCMNYRKNRIHQLLLGCRLSF